MITSTKHRQPSVDSVLRQIPDAISPRCKRSRCLGSQCQGWNSCGPSTPGGGYLVHLARNRARNLAQDGCSEGETAQAS